MTGTTRAGVAVGAMLATDCAVTSHTERQLWRRPDLALPRIASLAISDAARGSAVTEDLRGGGLARRDGAVHEALEVDGRVLAGEMHVALARALVTRDRRALADRPIRVRAFVPPVAGPIVHEGFAVPRFRDAGIQRFQTGE